MVEQLKGTTIVRFTQSITSYLSIRIIFISDWCTASKQIQINPCNTASEISILTIWKYSVQDIEIVMNPFSYRVILFRGLSVFFIPFNVATIEGSIPFWSIQYFVKSFSMLKPLVNGIIRLWRETSLSLRQGCNSRPPLAIIINV